MDVVLSHLTSDQRAAAAEDLIQTLLASRPERVDLGLIPTYLQLAHGTDIPRILPDVLYDEICGKQNDSERIFAIAETCLLNADLTSAVIHRCEDMLINSINIPFENEVPELVALIRREYPRQLDDSTSGSDNLRDHSILTERCLHFLRCFFLTQTDRKPRAPLCTTLLLFGLLGSTKTLSKSSHEAVSALLHAFDRAISRVDEVVAGWLWTSLCHLLYDVDPQKLEAKVSSASATFRLWYQLVSLPGLGGLEPQCIEDPRYWAMLQAGLLHGFTEQRKYCLGILRKTIALSMHDVSVPNMVLRVHRGEAYEAQYERFCTLFERIVLDRYANQVQACLPELSELLAPGSNVHWAWSSVLLSGSLNPKIQDGVRKIIGSWYLRFINNGRGTLLGQQIFLLDGFLPWATQGPLFTSSLRSGRIRTYCEHGDELTHLIARFTADAVANENESLPNQLLRYVLDRRGRIFAYSIPYLIAGVLQGYRTGKNLNKLHLLDLRSILQLSRSPGLPEVARDLCTTYCAAFFLHLPCENDEFGNTPGSEDLVSRWTTLSSLGTSSQVTRSDELSAALSQLTTANSPPVGLFVNKFEGLRQISTRVADLVSICDFLIDALNASDAEELQCETLYAALDAVWDEAERHEFNRQIVVKLPSLLYHPTCLKVYLKHQNERKFQESLGPFICKATKDLQQMAEGKTYMLASVAGSLRKACLSYPDAVQLLPIEQHLVRFIDRPPLPKTEFLFEVVAAEELQKHVPHRTYASYYGEREWHAYASVIDLINRMPETQIATAKRVLRRLIDPWRTQKTPVPIISKWKECFHLQMMLILSEFCISDADAEWYLEAFTQILVLEPWPRYRFLLEWIIARIYYRYPQYTNRILPDLANVSDINPRLVASHMKLAIMVASFLLAEDFTLQLMTQLIPFSSSQKVHIRHEAHWSVPIVWAIAEKHAWSSILQNPAFQALNKHIRGLERFSVPVTSSRGLKLDPVADFSLTNIFEGEYMRVDQPEKQLVAHEDFVSLWAKDGFDLPPGRIPLGDPIKLASSDSIHDDITGGEASAMTSTETPAIPAPLQTKSIAELPTVMIDTPSARKRPSPLILVASLIDNPTNLGGLSRISESFGLDSLYIRDLNALKSKDFQSTAVTSHHHLPIHDLKVEDVPDFLSDKKVEGYKVVAIEQTDRSTILGETDTQIGVARDGEIEAHIEGGLPKKCILVLGSEREGVSAEVLAVVDRCVEIKTVGFTRSLNVQTAGGIVVYEWWREWGGKL